MKWTFRGEGEVMARFWVMVVGLRVYAFKSPLDQESCIFSSNK